MCLFAPNGQQMLGSKISTDFSRKWQFYYLFYTSQSKRKMYGGSLRMDKKGNE